MYIREMQKRKVLTSSWSLSFLDPKPLKSPFLAIASKAEQHTGVGRALESRDPGSNLDFPPAGCGSYSLSQPPFSWVEKCVVGEER